MSLKEEILNALKLQATRLAQVAKERGDSDAEFRFQMGIAKLWKQNAEYTHNVMAFITGWTEAKGFNNPLNFDMVQAITDAIPEFLEGSGYSLGDGAEPNPLEELLKGLQASLEA